MSSITPRGGWIPVAETPQTTQYQPVQAAPQVIYVQVAARPKSVAGSFFKFLLWCFLIPVLLVLPPFGPIILLILFFVWAVRRDGAKTPVTYRVH